MNNEFGIERLIKIEKIGEGTYGEVFLAKDKDTGKLYAVKIFRDEFSKNSKDYLVDLFDEVELCSKLDHPSILPFIAFSFFGFDDEQRPAIITKYAVNGSLDQIMSYHRQYPLIPFWDNTKKLCCIYGIASGISYLHSNEVVHLDLKPANILLNEYLFPLICDFGLSKILDPTQQKMSASSSKGVIGTPIYVAPEFWKDKKYSKACDVYSFALVIYSIFTNEEPFVNYNQYQFFTNIIHNGERPKLNSYIPEPIKQLISRCWSENPEERPDFDHIVKELAENPEYLFNGVDIEKYHKYIELINQYKASFDANNKLVKQEDIFENIFEKIDISKEINKEPEINIAFKNLFLVKINELRQFPLKKQETIKNTINDKDKKVNFYRIHINSDQVAELYKDEILNSPYFLGLLRFFMNIEIDIQFPSTYYFSIMALLTTIKTNYIPRIIITGYVCNVEAIGHEFKNNTIINNIIINPPVSSIKEEAFRGCILLKSVTIPATVETIERSTFSMCEKLENVTILGNLQKIGVNAFRGDHMLKRIHLPSSIVEIGESCFRGENTLEHIDLPENLIAINDSVLKGCVLLKNIIIPPHVKLIDTGAFEECVKLCKVKIPPSVEIIKNGAFKCCVALSEVSFDPSKTNIEENAFFDCSKLTLLRITTSEETLHLDLKPFPNVKEIVIPPNVTSIDNLPPEIEVRVSSSNIGDIGIAGIPMTDDSLGRLGIDSMNKT